MVNFNLKNELTALEVVLSGTKPESPLKIKKLADGE